MAKSRLQRPQAHAEFGGNIRDSNRCSSVVDHVTFGAAGPPVDVASIGCAEIDDATNVRLWPFCDITRDTNEGCFQAASGYPYAGPAMPVSEFTTEWRKIPWALGLAQN